MLRWGPRNEYGESIALVLALVGRRSLRPFTALLWLRRFFPFGNTCTKQLGQVFRGFVADDMIARRTRMPVTIPTLEMPKMRVEPVIHHDHAARL